MCPAEGRVSDGQLRTSPLFAFLSSSMSFTETTWTPCRFCTVRMLTTTAPSMGNAEVSRPLRRLCATRVLTAAPASVRNTKVSRPTRSFRTPRLLTPSPSTMRRTKLRRTPRQLLTPFDMTQLYTEPAPRFFRTSFSFLRVVRVLTLRTWTRTVSQPANWARELVVRIRRKRRRRVEHDRA